MSQHNVNQDPENKLNNFKLNTNDRNKILLKIKSKMNK